MMASDFACAGLLGILGAWDAARARPIYPAPVYRSHPTNTVLAADIAVAIPLEDSLAVFLNHGDATFPSLTRLPDPPASASSALGVADLDGDGRPDLATVSLDGSTVRLANPDGSFSRHRD
jgi:hypothetical protein